MPPRRKRAEQALCRDISGPRTLKTRRKRGRLSTPGQGLEPQIRAPEARVLPITPSRTAGSAGGGSGCRPKDSGECRDQRLDLEAVAVRREVAGDRLLETRI